MTSKQLQSLLDEMCQDAINLVFSHPAESRRLSIDHARIVARWNNEHPLDEVK